MSIVADVRSREHGLKDVFSFTVSSVIDRFTCLRQDEHHIEAQEFGECTPPLACKFSSVSPHTLAIADEDGGILILNTHSPGIKAIQQDWLAHKNAVFDVDWMPGENKLLTASGDQTTILWDVENEEKLSVFKGHSGSVKASRFCPDNKHIFATGARDGHILLYDSRVKEKDGYIPAVNMIKNAHKSVPAAGSAHKKRKTNQQDAQQSVTAIVFQDEYTVISAGSVDGSINVWDLRKNYSLLKTDATPKHQFKYAGSSARSHGFSSLVLDSTHSKLFASCMDNIIYQYDATAYSKSPVAYYRGHKNTTFYIKSVLSPDQQFLLSGSSDNSAYIWRVSEPTARPWLLQGHAGEVSAVDWCRTDVGKLVTVSDDSTIRVWRLGVDDEKTAVFGDRVGSVQRPQEKGISVNIGGLDALPQSKRVALTPRKGNTVPQSPAKMSPAVKQSILGLSASKVKAVTPGTMKSPSIANWFTKSQGKKVQASPLKNTPKKLFITPKKQLASAEVAPSSPLPPSSVKRKLYDQNSPPDEPSTSKRAKTDASFFAGHVPDENSCDGFPSLLDKSPQVRQRNAAGLDFSPCSSSRNSDILTPVKPDNDNKPKEFESPTVNLPNYVFDPVPRTPVARTQSGDKTPKTPNWFTRIRMQKTTMSATKAPNAEMEMTTPKSTAVQPERSCKTTPRRKKVAMKRRGSIAQYFSPGNPEPKKKKAEDN